MIPAGRYNQRLADQLLEYLLSELRRSQGERTNLENAWMKYHQLYRARPEEDVKEFPFYGAANLVIPVIATDIDTIYARLMSMLFAPQNLWSCKPLRDDMVDFAPRLQEFLQWSQDNELKMYDVVADWLLELCKLGTAVLKTRYTREYKKVYEFRESQSLDGMAPQILERQVRMLLKDHPSVHHVSLWDFFIPSGATNLQSAPWCGERIMLTWPQFVNRVNAGIYTNIQNVGYSWARARSSRVQRGLEELDRYVPSQGDKFEMYEFWVDWDIDGDGEQEALVCTIHPDSHSYIRLDYNPFFNQEKPYDYARYLRVEKRFYGIGVAEMLEMFQQEITTMHNQRIDSNTVRNAQIIVAEKTGNIKQDEPIFPGRILLVDRIDEVKAFNFGTGYDTSIQEENLSLQYADRRVGSSDWISGGDDPSIGYSTATTAIQQLREGAKRFDQTLREIRQALGPGVGTKVAELYQQFNQGQKPIYALGQKDGSIVQQILSFPTEIIRSGVLVEITATSAANNKEVEVRTNTIIMQTLTQYYTQLMQFVSTAINPQVPPQLRIIAMQAAQGGSIILRRMLDNYGVQDTDRLLPDLQEALGFGQQQLGILTSPISGGAPMAPQSGGAPGMGLLPAGSQGAASGPVGGPGAGGISQGFPPSAGQY